MATQADIDAGAQALKTYVESIDGWEANFVPWGTYEQGAQIVLSAWDSVGQADNSDALDLKKANCGMALYKSISDAGYGDRVTVEQCESGAVAVLSAANRQS